MDLTKCKDWILNKNVNPITKRKIKTDGIVYKKLKNLCNNDNDNNDICSKWKLNKNINPITKRKIKTYGPIYKYYQNLCNQNKILSILSSFNSSSSSGNNNSSSSIIIDSSLSYSITKSKNNELLEKFINIIKFKRKKNLLLINSFLNEKFNISGNNNCLTVKNNRIFINDILKLKNVIGSGSYGIVYLMDYLNKIDNEIIKYVIKLTVLKKHDPQHEIRILEFLTKYALDHEFPHFPITYDILSCNRNKRKKLIEKNIDDIQYHLFEKLKKNNGEILFIINEYFNGGDFGTYNKLNIRKYGYDQLKIKTLNAISQILIAILFYHKKVNSSHGDIHSYNVLNHLTKSGGFFHYKLYDKDYYIENLGHIWVLWDFGFSVPFDNSLEINMKREKELKNHIFKYLINKKEPEKIKYYLGTRMKKFDYFYDEFDNEFEIFRNNILFDLKFFNDLNDKYCIYRAFIRDDKISNYKFINELVNTLNTDVVYKCLKLKLKSYDLPIMQKMIIGWMVKMNLLLTSIPPKSVIINEGNPYVL